MYRNAFLKLFVYFLIALSPIHALISLDKKEKDKKCPPPKETACSSGPIVLKGILLIPEQNSSCEQIAQVEGIDALMEVPGGIGKLNETLSSQYLNREIEPNDLIEFKKALISYYREQGYPFIVVEYPPQKIQNGVLRIVVIEGKLGEIRIEGNKWFPTSMIKRYVRQKSGEPIKTKSLMDDIAWINRNPFRHADLIFSQGKNEGTTDIDVLVKDRFPLRVYAGGDNTGNSTTGNARWFAGFNWGDFLLFDQILSYQYTTSSDFAQFQAHTVNYMALLSCRHLLHIYGGYSYVKPDITGFKTTGHSSQGSLRYIVPFASYLNSELHDLSFGGDLKNTNNNLEFEGSQNLAVIARTVNISQLYAGYNFAKRNEHSKFVCAIEAFWSPGRWLPNQSNIDFSDLHPGAVNHYIYSRLAVSEFYTLPYKFALFGEFRGQLSNENLVPSEQFGLGGYDTVRGYAERVVNYDSALCLNLEFHLPSFKVFQLKDEELTFLGFFDYGTGRNVHSTGGFENWQHLIGVGPGLRYKIGSYLTARVDLGFKLSPTQFDDNLNGKFHLGMIASY